MALLMGITLPAGWDIIYNRTLRKYDISVMCNVGKNTIWFPRKKFVQLKEITYLFQIAYAWSAKTEDQKAEWNYAANVIGQHNYNLYVQDKSYRIKNGIAGDATPSLYHQYLVGHISIAEPANACTLAQYNTHRIIFPCSFETCIKTALVASGDNPSVKLKLIWTRYYMGANIEETETINIPLITDWDKVKKYVESKKGVKGRWRILLEAIDVRGDIWFDNFIVQYGGQVRTNDAYCLDVVKWYRVENPAEGITLSTVYPPD